MSTVNGTPSTPNGTADPAQSPAARAHQRAIDIAESLDRERRVSEARLAELKQDDVLKRVTGTSALERAVAEARHIADELARATGS